jgi:membrane-anchored glycerophosphoryl diester phosphodiesterase (GDPDase)
MLALLLLVLCLVHVAFSLHLLRSVQRLERNAVDLRQYIGRTYARLCTVEVMLGLRRRN